MAVTTPSRRPDSDSRITPAAYRPQRVSHNSKSEGRGRGRDISWGAGAVIAFIATALAAFLRLWDSAGQSLRLDEGFSIRFAAAPLTPIYHGKTLYESSLFQLTAADVHPPGYLLLLHFWMQAVGTRIDLLRLPSEIAGILAVPALYMLGSTLYSRTVGFIAALLGAISPLWIWHAQEARMYPFLLLFTILSTYGFVQALEHKRWWGWPILFIASFLSIYTQYFAFMILLAQAFYLFTHLRQYSRAQVVTWFVVMGMLALTFMPWLYTLLHTYHGASDPSLQKPNIYTPLSILVGFLFGYLTTPVTSALLAAWPLLVLLCLVLTVFGGAATRRGSLLWMHFLVPVIVAFIISLTLRPFISERYLIVSTPALYIMIAVVVTSLRGQFLRFVILAAMATALIGSWHIEETNAANPNLEDFRTVANYITANAGPNDVVALDSFFNQDAFSYYLHTNLPIYALPSLPLTSGVPPKTTTAGLQKYMSAIEPGHTHIWVVYYLENNYDAANLVRHYLAYNTASNRVIKIGNNDLGGPYGRNDPHYLGSYTNVQLVEYTIIPQATSTVQIRPETIQEYRALTHISLTLDKPFESPFGVSGTTSSYNGAPLVMPQPTTNWQFPALPLSATAPHLTLFNSNQFRNDVWVSFQTSKGLMYRHVFIPALSNMDIALTTLKGVPAHAAIGLCTRSAVVPSRTSLGGQSARFEFASVVQAAPCPH